MNVMNINHTLDRPYLQPKTYFHIFFEIDLDLSYKTIPSKFNSKYK